MFILGLNACLVSYAYFKFQVGYLKMPRNQFNKKSKKNKIKSTFSSLSYSSTLLQHHPRHFSSPSYIINLLYYHLHPKKSTSLSFKETKTKPGNQHNRLHLTLLHTQKINPKRKNSTENIPDRKINPENKNPHPGRKSIIFFWVCLTCAILHMLKQLKVKTFFIIKNNNYLLKRYIFNIKCISYNVNLLFKTSLTCANLHMIENPHSFSSSSISSYQNCSFVILFAF